MQLIKEISRKDFDPQFKPDPNQKYRIRRAARAIVLYDGKIALINVTKKRSTRFLAVALKKERIPKKLSIEKSVKKQAVK